VYDAETNINATERKEEGALTKQYTLEGHVDEFWLGMRANIHEQYVMMIFRETFPIEVN